VCEHEALNPNSPPPKKKKKKKKVRTRKKRKGEKGANLLNGCLLAYFLSD
jgi:hypothetical protein